MSFASETPKQMIIAVSAGALFDMRREKAIFREKGQPAYVKHMRKNETTPLGPGPAMRFVQKICRYNSRHNLDQPPVKIILYTGNNETTGMRILNSVDHYDLDIEVGALLCGNSHNLNLLKEFKPDLYLTTDPEFAKEVSAAGIPSAVLEQPCLGNCTVAADDNSPLHIAYDFDGVLGDQSADEIFRAAGAAAVLNAEKGRPHDDFGDGPHMRFFRRLSWLQQCLEIQDGEDFFTISLVTARNFRLAHRVLDKLNSMHRKGYPNPIHFDNLLFMAGGVKANILRNLRPAVDIYFDDSAREIGFAKGLVNSAHVVNGGTAHAPTMSDAVNMNEKPRAPVRRQAREVCGVGGP